ncbi:hypothetical protein [Streptomyces canus]|uniref:hypothetical protein n=1 Tax=Streptomyces canus TaxID=58343 RepID=UPI002E36BE6A|nr:hypothetical protein [Streptomyces canus]
MKRREVQPTVDDGPPDHLLKLDPERYREVALQSLVDHPGDGWAAAVTIWRTWQDEAIAWQADRGIVHRVKGWKPQLVSCRPPMAWVREEFGLPVEGDGETPCPDNCRTHARRKTRRSRG